MKRVAYGYQNFQNFRYRILISIKVKKATRGHSLALPKQDFILTKFSSFTPFDVETNI
ncbi:hypothetical protein [Carnobacterium alterfunditum]|uniref:hypothetical protein n=1 Tax=Carnobacterium alterfunditum TaxID=28230 RepID=UPI003593887B